MNRRQIITLAGWTMAITATGACPPASVAATKIARVGIVDDGPDWEVFRQELRRLNYVEGQNIAFEDRRADGTP